MPPSFSSQLRNSVEKLRTRLLDLTGRNPSISFKHKNSSKKQIRVIDEIPDFLFTRLLNMKEFEICGIPIPDVEPPDEKTNEFKKKLKHAKANDPQFLTSLEELGETPNRRQLKVLDNELRDRLRADLNLPKVDRESRPPIKNEAEKIGFNTSFDLPNAGNQSIHTDGILQTLQYEDDLELILSSLCQHSELIESETGTVPLYLAVGFLEWYESESSTKNLTSPLILLPVEIRKEKGKQQDRYFLSAREPEPISNLSLSERLNKDFGFQLPSLIKNGDDGDFLKPSEYLSKVSTVIHKNKDWKVYNWATVSFFSFAKLAMYKELEGETLDKISADFTPLETLILGSTNSDENKFASDYDLEDEKIINDVPRVISSADTSQISAIMDALEGKNLVIEGPPGTGKSQTITNMIAALIERGKKVLFVAEKKAALTVVKERLTKANLAPFCLELHSTKSKRKEVIESLNSRLKVKKDKSAENSVADLERKISEIKQDLGKYINTLNKPHAPLGLSTHDILWRFMKIQDQCLGFLSTLKNLKISNSIERTKLDVERVEMLLRTLSSDFKQHILPFGQLKNHPWSKIIPSDKLIPEVDSYVQGLKAISEKLNKIEKLNAETSKEFFKRKTLNNIESSFEALDTLGKYSHSNYSWSLPLMDSFGAKTNEILQEIGKIKSQQKDVKEKVTEIAPGFLRVGFTAEQISSHLEIIRKQSFSDYNRSDLNRIYTELDIAKQNIESSMSNFHHISNLLGLKISLNSENLKRLYLLCGLLAKCPVQKWDLKNENLIFGDADSKIKEFIQTGRELKRVKGEVTLRCNLELAESLPLNEISETLKDAHFFSWFSSKYRRAKKASQSLLKIECDNTTASLHLTMIAKFVDNERAFKRHPASTLAFNKAENFKGLESDFDGLEEWQRYYNDISSWFAHSNFDTGVLQRILNLNSETIFGLRPFGVTSSVRQDSQSIPNENDKTLLEDRLTWIVKKIKLVGEVSDFLQLIEADMDFKCSSLESLLLDVLNFEMLSKKVNSGDCKIVFDICPDFDDYFERGLIDSAIEISSTLQTLELSKEEIKFILKSEFREWYSNADQAARETLKLKSEILTILDEVGATELGFNAISLLDLKNKITKGIEHDYSAAGYLEFLTSLDALRDEGLEDFLRVTLDEPQTAEQLDLAFRYVFYNTLTLEFHREDPKLFRSVSSKFTEYRTKYKDLDDKLMHAHQSYLSSKLCSRPIPQGISTGRKRDLTDLALIDHLVTLERPNVAVRDLLARARNAIQGLKPVFLMSPLSVAQMLPHDIKFDVVIMDEASQMKPEDALGSIARATQVIVVGDPKQMPPSDYFSKSTDDETESEEDFVDIKQESILDLAMSTFRPPRRLKWHYRSRNEELIAFSNHHFYDGDLIIFPSARTSEHTQGVQLENINGIYGSGLNQTEAKATVDRAISLIKNRPTASMMIVAMNQKQSELINDLLSEREKDDPILEKYRDHWKNTLEPLIVRNLENVQGDERDVVIISTVYGPDSNGHVFQRFGPIGSEYGHRRLNVLYTRAKELMWIVTSLDDNLIVTSANSSRGVHALKNFLHYARTRKLGAEVTSFGERPPDSDFELHVAQKLKQRLPDLDIVAQVGVAGFFIDLAVKHPKKEGAFLLGIECDGKTYHSSKSARDRDKIRQQILEDLGWSLHRIWSTDWFTNPEIEIKKLVARIQSLL